VSETPFVISRILFSGFTYNNKIFVKNYVMVVINNTKVSGPYKVVDIGTNSVMVEKVKTTKGCFTYHWYNSKSVILADKMKVTHPEEFL